jgi:hypothetical protein
VTTDAEWVAVDLPVYGVSLRLPPGWETLPPAPSNSEQELLRATGDGGMQVIVFKFHSRGLTASEVATRTRARLETLGFTDFARTEVSFAGSAGALLSFRSTTSDYPERTSWEYFAVRGPAAFALGLSSAEPDTDRETAEAISGAVRLTP